MERTTGYSLFDAFIARYLPQGFQHISRLDPFMIDMEEKLKNLNQFFYIADLLTIQILFTSAASQRFIGVNPDEVDAYTFFKYANPQDQERLNRAQSKLFKLGQDLLAEQEKIAIVSVQIRERDAAGNYMDLLLQTYSFYSEVPHKTVFTLIVATQLAPVKSDHEFHYYVGYDPAMFRYPDKVLLREGHRFSNRELEIIRLIAAGLSSEQIADKLSLSVTTVSTHRRNILKKTKKSTTHQLIVEMQENGIL